jgi:hypothetical protein
MLLLSAISQSEENWGTGPVGAVRPAAGAPVTVLQVEERRWTLADGTVTTEVLKTQVYRDSAGRVRMEWLLGDGSGRSAGFVNLLDPVAYLEVMLLPEEKVAYPATVSRSGSAGFQAGLPIVGGGFPAGRGLPKGKTKWKTQEEALGVRVIEGIETQGMRWVSTLEEQPALVASRERWSSEVLGLTLEEKVVGPTWAHMVKLQNLYRSEPDPALFVVPPDSPSKGSSFENARNPAGQAPLLAFVARPHLERKTPISDFIRVRAFQ